jgi:hypothetical protein
MFFLEQIEGTGFTILTWSIMGLCYDEMVPSGAYEQYNMKEGERRQLTYKEFRNLLQYCPTLHEEYYSWLSAN